MYDELIKKLRHCGNAISCLHCPYWEGCGGSKEDLTQAADTIEYLSSYFEYYCPHYIQNVHDGDDKSLCAFWGCDVKSLPRWIPVTERLPMIGEKAICFGKNGYMIGTYGEFGWMFPCYFGNVTHWMPLPKQPEEE